MSLACCCFCFSVSFFASLFIFLILIRILNGRAITTAMWCWFIFSYTYTNRIQLLFLELPIEISTKSIQTLSQWFLFNQFYKHFDFILFTEKKTSFYKNEWKIFVFYIFNQRTAASRSTPNKRFLSCPILDRKWIELYGICVWNSVLFWIWM